MGESFFGDTVFAYQVRKGHAGTKINEEIFLVNPATWPLFIPPSTIPIHSFQLLWQGRSFKLCLYVLEEI
jgi:hypothetical protein